MVNLSNGSFAEMHKRHAEGIFVARTGRILYGGRNCNGDSDFCDADTGAVLGDDVVLATPFVSGDDEHVLSIGRSIHRRHTLPSTDFHAWIVAANAYGTFMVVDNNVDLFLIHY